MKYFESMKYKVIYAKSAATFEKKLNDAITDLNDHKLDVKLAEQCPSGFLAYITYTETKKIPENLGDELELRGLQIKCCDCPYLQRTNRLNQKRLKCKYAPYGKTFIDSPACNKFYEELIQMFLQYKENSLDKEHMLTGSQLEIPSRTE